MGGEDEELQARESRILLQENWWANIDEFLVALPSINVSSLAPNGMSSFAWRSYIWLLTGEYESVSPYIDLVAIVTILMILHKCFGTIEEHKSS